MPPSRRTPALDLEDERSSIGSASTLAAATIEGPPLPRETKATRGSRFVGGGETSSTGPQLYSTTKFDGLVAVRGTPSTFDTIARIGMPTARPSLVDTDSEQAMPPPTVSTGPYGSSIPDVPLILGPLLAGLLVLGFAAAILLYFVNFPPRIRSPGVYKRVRHQYIEVNQTAHEISSSPVKTEDAEAATTSAHTPTLLARRRKQHNLTVNTTANYEGLGIALPGDDPSSMPGTLIDRCQTLPLARSMPPTATPYLKPWRHFDADEPPSYELQNRHPDLEGGLLTFPADRDLTPPELFVTPASVAGSPSSSSSNVRLLTRVGDGIEYATDRLARLLHDQVRNDPEEGLLPMRSAEIRAGGYWKKVY